MSATPKRTHDGRHRPAPRDPDVSAVRLLLRPLVEQPNANARVATARRIGGSNRRGKGFVGRHVRAHAIPPPEASPQLELAPAGLPDALLEERLRPCPDATWNPLTLEWEAP